MRVSIELFVGNCCKKIPYSPANCVFSPLFPPLSEALGLILGSSKQLSGQPVHEHSPVLSLEGRNHEVLQRILRTI